METQARRFEQALVGRLRRIANERIREMHEPSALHGPRHHYETILAELARQGHWASMAMHLHGLSEDR